MRSNNGVSSKVTHNIKREVPGYTHQAPDTGNVLGGGKVLHNKQAGTTQDMASHNGPKGSSGKEMGMGGVDIKGADGSHKIGFKSHKG